jgi:hypothetical protein
MLCRANLARSRFRQMTAMTSMLAPHGGTPSPDTHELLPLMTTQPDESLVEIACEYFPLEVRNAYAELLHRQAQGNLPSPKDCCRQIAEKLVARRVTPRLALKLHLATMEQIISTLGPACTKQVLTSGDVLVLELMTALADAYRQLEPPAPVRAPHRKTWFATT